jgi:uncharacterized membrane protein
MSVDWLYRGSTTPADWSDPYPLTPTLATARHDCVRLAELLDAERAARKAAERECAAWCTMALALLGGGHSPQPHAPEAIVPAPDVPGRPR